MFSISNVVFKVPIVSGLLFVSRGKLQCLRTSLHIRILIPRCQGPCNKSSPSYIVFETGRTHGEADEVQLDEHGLRPEQRRSRRRCNHVMTSAYFRCDSAARDRQGLGTHNPWSITPTKSVGSVFCCSKSKSSTPWKLGTRSDPGSALGVCSELYYIIAQRKLDTHYTAQHNTIVGHRACECDFVRRFYAGAVYNLQIGVP